MLTTKEEIRTWLGEMKIKKFTINKDLTVDLREDVNLSHKNLTALPVQFNKAKNFNISYNDLISLKGCPYEVNGDFSCAHNHLNSLEYAPKIAKGDFNCSNNVLISLKGSPTVIERDFYCFKNQLSSLELGPLTVKGNYSCSDNMLTNLTFSPKEIGKSFDCDNNYLTTLEGMPEKTAIYFSCINNPQLKEFPASHISVGYHFITDNPFHIETIFKVRPYFALVKVGHKKVAKINFDNFKTEIEAQILDTQLSQMPIKNKAIKL